MKLPSERIIAITEAANATIKAIKKEFKISSNGILFLIFSEDQAISCVRGMTKVITKTSEQNRVIKKLKILLGLIKLLFALPAPDNFLVSEFSPLIYKMIIAKEKSIRDIFAPDIKS